jgi:hypothetical protein
MIARDDQQDEAQDDDHSDQQVGQDGWPVVLEHREHVLDLELVASGRFEIGEVNTILQRIDEQKAVGQGHEAQHGAGAFHLLGRMRHGPTGKAEEDEDQEDDEQLQDILPQLLPSVPVAGQHAGLKTACGQRDPSALLIHVGLLC